MSAAEYSPKALDDLKSIFDFIAADRPQAAMNAVQRVLDAGDTLAKFPELGTTVVRPQWPDTARPRLRQVRARSQPLSSSPHDNTACSLGSQNISNESVNFISLRVHFQARGSFDVSRLGRWALGAVRRTLGQPGHRHGSLSSAGAARCRMRQRVGEAHLDQPLQRATHLGGQRHRRLDEAVFAAYGWPADLTDDEILAKLLELNLGREPAA